MGAITVGVNNMIDHKSMRNIDANKTDESQTSVYQRKVFNYGNNDSPKSTENRLGPKLAVNINQNKVA